MVFLRIIVEYVTCTSLISHRTRKVTHFTTKFNANKFQSNYTHKLGRNYCELFEKPRFQPLESICILIAKKKKEVRHMSRKVLIKLLSFVNDDEDISSCN